MIDSLLPLLLLLASFEVWRSALRARELAREFGRGLCASAHVQLLDQTVALQRLRLVRTHGRGLRVRRDWSFEFSIDGRDRHRGALSVLGGVLLAHTLALPADGSAIEHAGAPTGLPPGHGAPT